MYTNFSKHWSLTDFLGNEPENSDAVAKFNAQNKLCTQGNLSLISADRCQEFLEKSY